MTFATDCFGGSGTTTLLGANTFTGGTVLSGGGLIAGNGAALGTGALNVTGIGGTLATNVGGTVLGNAVNLGAGATLGLNGAADLGLNGTISGAGGLALGGTGATTLSGANTFTGGASLTGGGSLIVEGGTALGVGGALNVSGLGGSLSADLAAGAALANGINLNGASLTLNGANNLGLSGTIGGSGGLVLSGTGTTTLSGANTFGGGTTLSAGTLLAGSNTALGSGALNVAGAGGALGASVSGTALGNAVNLGTGENILNPALPGVLDTLHERGVRTSLTSNGKSLLELDEERLSAAGPGETEAAKAALPQQVPVSARSGMVNPEGHDWERQNFVPRAQALKLQGLWEAWCSEDVFCADDLEGTGPEEIDTGEDLDDWQRFAHDIVKAAADEAPSPLRLIMTGTAGTGKSRTIKAMVKARSFKRVVGKFGAKSSGRPCLLAAPTGCASFQLKNGATTVHRAFGVPVGFCGRAKNKNTVAFARRQTRLRCARIFIIDEFSM